MALGNDRFGVEILDDVECDAHVGEGTIGRVAFVADGDIVIFPVTYVQDGRSVAFRTAPGQKLSAAIMGRPVAFEIDGWDSSTRSGWSVLMKGTADSVTDPKTLARLEATGLEPWASTDHRDRWVRITAQEISGRRVGA